MLLKFVWCFKTVWNLNYIAAGDQTVNWTSKQSIQQEVEYNDPKSHKVTEETIEHVFKTEGAERSVDMQTECERTIQTEEELNNKNTNNNNESSHSHSHAPRIEYHNHPITIQKI